jgi:putative ABC transport system permease protein
MIGIALMGLFAVLINSLEQTADRQLASHYPVDYVMVAAAPPESSDQPGIPSAYAQALRQQPDFSGVAEIRVATATFNGSPGAVGAIDPAALGRLIQPDLAAGSLTDLRPGTVILSDAHRDIPLGQTVTIAVGHRSVALTVAGTAHDTTLGSDKVDALVSWDQMIALAGPGDDTSVMAKLAPGITPTSASDALDALADSYPLVQVSSVADLTSDLRSSVDALIALFGGLIAIAIIIALFGIANTLSLSVVERTRESAMVRAIGLTSAQLRATLVTESILMGVVGAIVGVAYGLVYGRLVVEKALVAVSPVIVTPWNWLVALILLAGLAALLAALLPARRATRISIVEAMADEG